MRPRPGAGAGADGVAELRVTEGEQHLGVDSASLAPTPLWCPAYVAIGSNLGSPRERVIEAFQRLAAWPAVRAMRRSRLYLSAPMGPRDQPQFVNAVAGFLTHLRARELLIGLLAIERDMGRERALRWGPRIIDLDLLWLVDGAVEEPGLTVPHPEVRRRNFVLYPLADLAPALKIPGLGNVESLRQSVGSEDISVLE